MNGSFQADDDNIDPVAHPHYPPRPLRATRPLCTVVGEAGQEVDDAPKESTVDDPVAHPHYPPRPPRASHLVYSVLSGTASEEDGAKGPFLSV